MFKLCNGYLTLRDMHIAPALPEPQLRPIKVKMSDGDGGDTRNHIDSLIVDPCVRGQGRR